MSTQLYHLLSKFPFSFPCQPQVRLLHLCSLQLQQHVLRLLGKFRTSAALSSSYTGFVNTTIPNWRFALNGSCKRTLIESWGLCLFLLSSLQLFSSRVMKKACSDWCLEDGGEEVWCGGKGRRWCSSNHPSPLWPHRGELSFSASTCGSKAEETLRENETNLLQIIFKIPLTNDV